MSILIGLLLGLPLCPWHADRREEPAPGPSDQPGAWLYEEGSIHDFAFELTPDAVDLLGRDEPDVHARMTYMGVSWDVGFKLKGSSTYQDLGGKPSLKVDLEQWVDDQQVLGVRRFTLNAMTFDSTMLREHAAYRLYAAMGVPAPRHGWARVAINGKDYGLYGVIETLDEQWLRRNFPGDSEGNLYDSTYTYADLTGTGLPNYPLEEGKPLEPYADLKALVDDIDSMDILELLDTRFDREAVLAMWAVDIATPNWDGYSRNTNNYLLYHATVADRWYFVPWGQDTAFRGGGSLYAGVRGRLVTACLGDSACRAALEDKLVTVVDTWVGMDLAGYAEAAGQDIAADCASDPRRSGRCEPEKLIEALRERPEQVRAELP